jgi:hypothetical protein
MEKIKSHLGYDHKYRFIKVPHHPYKRKDGTLLEHRYIMEQHIGRYLTKDDIVHHINGIVDDNRIENLQLLSRGEHTSLHNKGRKWNKEQRNKWSKKQKNNWIRRKT